MSEGTETNVKRIGFGKRVCAERGECVLNSDKGPTIIIDCGYDNKHSERNIKSLVVQLSLSYSCIRRSSTPLRLIICGVSDRLYEGLLRTLAYNWVGVELIRQGLRELLSERYASGSRDGSATEGASRDSECNITYLTADSDNVLQHGDGIGFGREQVFIIGGIIDRNRHKNASRVRAEELNLETARLPIRESGVTLSSNEVLTVNHVVECIVRRCEGANWRDAFSSVLPKRKVGAA
ncbi:hypothetical protein FG386_003452 [Cryptosporidium ryanae]|uniref:uncharacterized protein n=1 Tax=Cryptosporidium ryanae TaxID=515981 RepID=UPI00351A7BE0|nr:hypothetical protein FG386_003452 [Cryptosporidium ryanae]